jgi:hypothetical protein
MTLFFSSIYLSLVLLISTAPSVMRENGKGSGCLNKASPAALLWSITLNKKLSGSPPNGGSMNPYLVAIFLYRMISEPT